MARNLLPFYWSLSSILIQNQANRIIYFKVMKNMYPHSWKVKPDLEESLVHPTLYSKKKVLLKAKNILQIYYIQK